MGGENTEDLGEQNVWGTAWKNNTSETRLQVVLQEGDPPTIKSENKTTSLLRGPLKQSHSFIF